VRGIALPRPRWGDAYTLDDLLSQTGGGSLAARDFALVTLAGHLSASFPGQLVFKGGFVLRHAHGIPRFSEDIDGLLAGRGPATALLADGQRCLSRPESSTPRGCLTADWGASSDEAARG